MDWRDMLGLGKSEEEYVQGSVPEYQDPRALQEHMQRMQDYVPQGDEAVAQAQSDALRKQAEAMVGGSGIGGARQLSRMNNHGLDESGGDDEGKAEAFMKLRAMLGGR